MALVVCAILYLSVGVFIAEVTELIYSEDWKARVFGTIAIALTWLPLLLFFGSQEAWEYQRKRRAAVRSARASARKDVS